MAAIPVDGVRVGAYTVDDVEYPLSFHGDLTPVEVAAQLLRHLASLRIAHGYGYDELIEIAQQLDGGDGP